MKPGTPRAKSPWGSVEVAVFLAVGGIQYAVHGRRLYALLERLGLVEDAARRVALVFAVPEIRTDGLKDRSIEGSKVVDNSFPLTAVRGLKTETMTVLKAAGVHNIQGLRHLSKGVVLDEEQLQMYEEAQALLTQQENEAVVSGSARHEMLKLIPQFVWVVYH